MFSLVFFLRKYVDFLNICRNGLLMWNKKWWKNNKGVFVGIFSNV